METNCAELRGVPEATARALCVLLETLPHLSREDIELVLRLIEDNGSPLSTFADEESLLTLDGVAKELGKDRTTLWRWFKQAPEMRKILGEITDQPGNPLYSKSAVRSFKGSGGVKRRRKQKKGT